MIMGVKLAAPVLVVTDRGEVEARAGDYLAVTEDGRQVVMTEAEYLAASGTAPVESTAVGIPEAPVSKSPVKREPAVPSFLGSLLKRKRAAPPPPPPAPVQVLELEPSQPAVEVEASAAPAAEPEKPRPDSPSRARSPVPLPLAPPRPAPVAPARNPLLPTSVEDLELLLHAKRGPGSFASSMKPGAQKPPQKKKKAAGLPFPFVRKKKKPAETETKRKKYEYVEEQWI